MSGLTLDTGALIAFERNDRKLVALLARAVELGLAIAVPAGVVAQAWRDGRRQARLSRLLSSNTVSIEPLSDQYAREAGQLCGARRKNDVIDASVVLCAKRRGDRIVTSDVSDLRLLAPKAELIPV